MVKMIKSYKNIRNELIMVKDKIECLPENDPTKSRLLRKMNINISMINYLIKMISIGYLVGIVFVVLGCYFLICGIKHGSLTLKALSHFNNNTEDYGYFEIEGAILDINLHDFGEDSQGQKAHLYSYFPVVPPLFDSKQKVSLFIKVRPSDKEKLSTQNKISEPKGPFNITKFTGLAIGAYPEEILSDVTSRGIKVSENTTVIDFDASPEGDIEIGLFFIVMGLSLIVFITIIIFILKLSAKKEVKKILLKIS